MSNYNLINAQKCLEAYPGRPKRILIAGCGTHCEDVKCFNKLLDSDVEIVGVDITSNIGMNYQPANATYIRCDISELPIMSHNFDISYTFATFEHVHNIIDGWQNMINALRAGGLFWSVSSPLWMSPYGHHKADIFKDKPWIHLYHPDPEELIDYCRVENIVSTDDIDIQHHIRYMLNPQYFNKLSAAAYSDSTNSLSGLASISSSFDSISEKNLDGHDKLLEIGYSANDLLAMTHYLSGIKA